MAGSRIRTGECMKSLRIATAVALLPLMILLGGWACNVQNVVDRVNSILAEVGPALQIVASLLPLLGTKNIPPEVTSGIQAWIPRVQADSQQLGALVQQYQSDLASPGTQAKINAAV